MTIGISNSGAETENRFRFITGASPVPSSLKAKGDAVIAGRYIEIKHAGSNTLNQIRALKWSPLVVLHAPTNQWYVVPAHVLPVLVAAKKRGQHTENPLESATLSVSTLQPYRVKEDEMLTTILNSFEEDEKHTEMKEALSSFLLEIQELKASQCAKIMTIAKS
jgi:hypothetical protein